MQPSTDVTGSESETIHLARRLASDLEPGTVLLLHGDLGAGKTVFVRGLAEGLGADPELVSSPTFTICQHYTGRLPLHHVDLYRLTEPEADDLGLEELQAGGGVLAIEWPERLARPPAGAIEVWIDDLGADRRRIRVTRRTED